MQTSVTIDSLDYQSLIQIANFLAEDISLETLIQKIMDTITKNFSAQRGVFFLSKEGKLLLEVEKTGNRPAKVLEESYEFDEIDENTNQIIPKSIIRYVQRKKVECLVENAQIDSTFSSDIYVRKYKPLSILCFPLLKEEEVIGIIYLENHFLQGAFSNNSLKLLRILCSQIVITLENKRLMENVNLASQIIKSLLNDTKKEVIKKSKEHISVKEDFNHFIIPIHKIIYLSFHNAITHIHTLEKVYKTNRSLKLTMQELDKEVFLRVHKNYGINIHWVSHLQYYVNGSYLAFLKDKETTEVPVGRVYSNAIKEKFGIH
ncbi:MAG: LytTR family transcriptional regulator DNA-binding domain-containing protein [Spirochaetota bacterium]